MNLKELTPKEALKKLYEEGRFVAYVKNNDTDEYDKRIIDAVGVPNDNVIYPFYTYPFWWKHCAIEVPDEYEPYPEDKMPNLKRLEGVIRTSIGTLEETVIAIKDVKNFLHIKLSDYGWISNETLFEEYTKLDGSPIGRIKEGK